MTQATGAKARETPKTPRVPKEKSKQPTNAKKAQEAAEACGFECFTFEANVHKDATLYASNGDNYKIGDIRYPEKDIDGWFLRARHLALPTELAFEAVWADGFHSARIIDPSGREREIRADYEYGAKQAKDLGYTAAYAEKMLQERNYRYNDGESYFQPKWQVDTWGEFASWIDGLIDAFKVDHPKISTVRKPKAAKTEEDIMYELLNPKSNL